jgi:hypothetical protein
LHALLQLADLFAHVLQFRVVGGMGSQRGENSHKKYCVFIHDETPDVVQEPGVLAGHQLCELLEQCWRPARSGGQGVNVLKQDIALRPGGGRQQMQGEGDGRTVQCAAELCILRALLTVVVVRCLFVLLMPCQGVLKCVRNSRLLGKQQGESEQQR